MAPIDPKRRLRTILLILFVLGLVLRFASIGEKSLWLDEMTSLDVARHGLPDIAFGKAFDNHTPPFYYVLLHGWLRIFPGTETGMRSLSAVIDAVNILLCYFAFAPLIPGMPALIVSLLYSLSAFSLYFAQEARMYPLVILLCLLFQGLILRLPSDGERPRYRRSILLGAVASCGLYTHYYFAPFALALGAVLLAANRRNTLYVRHLLLAGAIAALCFLPWIPVVLALAGKGGQSFREHLFLVIPYAAFRFTAGYGNLPLVPGLKSDVLQSILSNLPLILLYTLVPAALAVSAMKAGFRNSPRAFGILVWTLVVPPLLMLLISLKSPIFSERYLCIVFPQFLALVACALSPFHENEAGPLLRLLRLTFFACLIFALYQHFENPRFGFSDWRAAAKAIRSAGSADPEGRGVVLVFPEYARPVLRHYLGANPPLLPFPDKPEEVPAALAGAGPLDTVFLVEPATRPTESGAITSAGWQALREQVFPFENGIRLTVFSKPR